MTVTHKLVINSLTVFSHVLNVINNTYMYCLIHILVLYYISSASLINSQWNTKNTLYTYAVTVNVEIGLILCFFVGEVNYITLKINLILTHVCPL